MALIDMDILCYRIGFACQKTRYTIGGIDLGTKKGKAKRLCIQHGHKMDDIEATLEVDSLANCLHSVKMAMQAIIDGVKADSYRGFLTGKSNFRETLVDYYKMNRKDKDKPYYYQAIRDYLTKHWNAEMCEYEEADDALSIAQMEARILPEVFDNEKTYEYPTVICTIDKDLKNTPGWNYNFVTKKLEFITEDQARLNFYVQLLTGDMTDNIPGLFQITGTRMHHKYTDPLAYCGTSEQMWEHVVGVYVSVFLPWADDDYWYEHQDIQEAVKDKLKETGILLWMRRSELEIWSPPNG